MGTFFSIFLKFWRLYIPSLSQPHLKECEDDILTPEMWTWESSRAPKYFELDCRGQNTLPWSVLYTIGKVSKCRCRKWPCMNYLDICSTSYGRKKGCESNCQFDSRPLKVGNRPDPMLAGGVWHTVGKLLKRTTSYFRPHPNRRFELGVMSSQSPRSPNRDIFETPPWESWDKKPFGCGCRGQMQRILYGGRCWLPPSLGHDEFCESIIARGLS
jgi:hypothetical protein